MLTEARAQGLVTDPCAVAKLVYGQMNDNGNGFVGPDALGQQHQSLRGLWHAAEWLPQRVWDAATERHRWQLFPQPAQPRTIPPDALSHASVLAPS